MSTIINATTTNGVVIQPDNSGSLVLQTNSGTTALTISTAQNATFAAQATIPTINLTGGQIVFPATQSASANANTLDDYEEGTWTPVIASTGGGTNTYVRQNGKYTKVGRLVAVEIDVRLNVNSMSTGDLSLTGLPFATGAVVYTSPIISAPTTTSAAYSINGYILAGASTIQLDRVTAAGTSATLTKATFASGEALAFTFSYTV